MFRFLSAAITLRFYIKWSPYINLLANFSEEQDELIGI